MNIEELLKDKSKKAKGGLIDFRKGMGAAIMLAGLIISQIKFRKSSEFITKKINS